MWLWVITEAVVSDGDAGSSDPSNPALALGARIIRFRRLARPLFLGSFVPRVPGPSIVSTVHGGRLASNRGETNLRPKLILTGFMLVSFLWLQLLEGAEHTKDSLSLVQARVESGQALLIDVREPSEWDDGHLQDATLVPLSRLRRSADLRQLAEQLPKDTVIYTHCRSGRRVLAATDILRPLGFDVRPLRHGYGALLEAGFKKAEPVGHVVGRVIYEADPKRPWRLGRYYIKNAKRGELAEAVVALTGPQLRAGQALRKPATVTVDQKNFRFIPETVAIRARDGVKFLNSDPEVHNVRSLGFAYQFNKTMPPKGEFVHRFDKAVDMNQPVVLGCVFHSAMRGWVFVFDHPFFQVTSADGRFRLENVPAGVYELQVSHPAGGLWLTRRVEVGAGRTVELNLHVSPDHKRKTAGQDASTD